MYTPMRSTRIPCKLHLNNTQNSQTDILFLSFFQKLMGDLTALTKARIELEELYSGVPDDSVNLTFQDLAEVRQQNAVQSEKKKGPQMDPIREVSTRKEEVSPLAKLPSLDFNRGLEATSRSDHPIHNYQNHHVLHNHHPFRNSHLTDQNHSVNHLHHGAGLDHHHGAAAGLHAHHANAHGHQRGMDHHANPFNHRSDHHAAGGFRHGMDSMAYDDTSGMTMTSMSGFPEIGRRRRPGIPHSKICTVCSNYIYIFRHRCLVCGRVYCRQCVGIGMGEMAEGRKCIECLGRRFSQRYIQRAGQIGCCMGYPSTVKLQELKWAEKGPRRSGEDRYGRSGMMSRSRSPNPRTPTRAQTPPNNNSSSFVVNSPYSPYFSPTNHPLPF